MDRASPGRRSGPVQGHHPARLDQHHVGRLEPAVQHRHGGAGVRHRDRLLRPHPLHARRPHDHLAELADPHQPVDAEPGGQPPEAVVLGGRLLPELRHLPEQGHGPAGPGPSAASGHQRLERRRHRGGVGVVGVVDDREAVGTPLYLHAHGRQRRPAEAGGDPLRLQPERVAGGSRGQRVGHQVLARRRQRGLGAAARGAQLEVRVAALVERDPLGADLGAWAEAELEHHRRGAPGHRRHQRVVGVEHGGAVRRQGLDQLALGRGDGGLGAEHAEVGDADVEHDPDLGARQPRQRGDVAGGAGAHLDHQRLGARLQPRQGQRQADLVVERGGVGDRGEPGRQHGGQQVLGRRLAGRPGHADHVRPRACPHRGAEGTQGGQRVVDLDARPRGDRAGRRQHRHRAGLQRLGGEAAAVGAAARQGDEQGARPDRARVGPQRGGNHRAFGLQQPATGGGGRLGERQRDHGAPPFERRARSSSAATTRSSKGTLRPPSNSCPCSWPLPAISTASPGRARASVWRMAARRSTSTW